MVQKKLTSAQQQELEGWKLDCKGFSDNALWRLYLFVKQGNETYGADETSRLQLVKGWISKWVSKTVLGHGRTAAGEVRYLLFRTKSETRLLRRLNIVVKKVIDVDSTPLGAFELMIRWEGTTRVTSNSPSSIKLAEAVQE